MVMVVKKKMVVVMAVMVVAVVGGHFDPKIKIWNSCLSTMSSQHKPRSHTQHPVTGPQSGTPSQDQLIGRWVGSPVGF